MRPTSESIMELFKIWDHAISLVDQAADYMNTIEDLKLENERLEHDYKYYTFPVQDLSDYIEHLRAMEKIDARRADIREVTHALDNELKTILSALGEIVPLGIDLKHPTEDYSFCLVAKNGDYPILDINYV